MTILPRYQRRTPISVTTTAAPRRYLRLSCRESRCARSGRSLSAELLPRRIRINVLGPGMTDTPIITREGGPPDVTPEQVAAAITKTIPLGRRALPEEMAKAMLFLASDDSSYCLGSELLVDGGFSQIVKPT